MGTRVVTRMGTAVGGVAGAQRAPRAVVLLLLIAFPSIGGGLLLLLVVVVVVVVVGVLLLKVLLLLDGELLALLALLLALQSESVLHSLSSSCGRGVRDGKRYDIRRHLP